VTNRPGATKLRVAIVKRQGASTLSDYSEARPGRLVAQPGKDKTMTDRYTALTVVLDEDIREDDADGLLTAIRQLRGVLDVTPHVANSETQIAIQRARSELGKKLWEVLYP
jgi:hypothetical protein